MNVFRRQRFEELECRRLLAIDWINRGTIGNDQDNFQNLYGLQDAIVARQIIDRAVSDWNAVIADQNFDNDSNPLTHDFQLAVNAFAFEALGQQFAGVRGDTSITAVTHGGAGQAGWTVGVPTAATVRVDNNGGGAGWFLDSTPLDDIEFTGLATPFHASFVDATLIGQARQNDFYRTVLHEIGHALGISFQLPTLAIVGNLYMFDSNNDGVYEVDTNPLGSGSVLLGYYSGTPQGAPFAVFTPDDGAHFYEGGTADQPLTPTHPHELMNAGRALPTGQSGSTPPFETTRQFISDLTVEVLADAYGYTAILPSTLDTAHGMLDSMTGTLLVQGRARNFATGVGANDTINLQRVIDSQGDNILVNVNGNLERVPFAQVRDIIIHGNGGTDSIAVNPNVTQPWQEVQYVVSNNQDALESSTSVGGSSTTNGIVDLSATIPGSQTTLRAAIVEANAAGTARGIYVGRGTYNLILTGTGGDTQGDLDIIGNVTIVGAGAGATIINASALGDRVLEIDGVGSSLTLARATITGGNISNHATAITGGGINVTNGATFNLQDSAVVGNTGKWYGGGIHSAGATTTTNITGSVVTGNQLPNTSAPMAYGGGGIYAISGTLTIANSMVANNNADVGQDDVFGVAATWTSLGNNALTTMHANLASDFPTTGSDPNYIGAANLVVTSLVDSLDANRSTDTVERSLREAIDLANVAATPQSIWLPAWNFVLTRGRNGGVGTTDIDVAQGDLDVKKSLTVRGITTALTRVQWKPGVADAVFDLLGDFTGDGLVGGADDGDRRRPRLFITGRPNMARALARRSSMTFSADGDDDGDVDSADLAIWQAYYSNLLSLTNLTAVLA